MKSIVVHIGLDNGQDARYRVAVDIARAFDGYLTCIQKANAHRQATYRLTRDSGPLAPQIQRVKQVFDPNSKTVYRKGEA